MESGDFPPCGRSSQILESRHEHPLDWRIDPLHWRVAVANRSLALLFFDRAIARVFSVKLISSSNVEAITLGRSSMLPGERAAAGASKRRTRARFPKMRREAAHRTASLRCTRGQGGTSTNRPNLRSSGRRHLEPREQLGIGALGNRNCDRIRTGAILRHDDGAVSGMHRGGPGTREIRVEFNDRIQ